MSYIDTFDHELVAFFAGLPLYHPLEVVSGARADEFACAPSELALGGGGGEHPAMVLRNPGAAVRHFLQAALPEDAANIPEAEQALLDDAPPASACVEFVDWGLERVASFVERCRSAAFVTPYDPTAPASEGPIEGWIVRNLGEFVYFAMPELVTHILPHLTAVCALVTKPIYLNVLILPPGYGAPAGRYLNNEGVIVWGNYPWITTRIR